MTEPKEKAVPVVGVEEAVEQAQAWLDDADKANICIDPWESIQHLRTILQALQGSSACADTHRATEQAVVDALRSAQTWLYTWGKHVGSCRGGGVCTCGLTAIREDVSGALEQAENCKLGGYEAEGGVNKDLQAQLKAAYGALERKDHVLREIRDADPFHVSHKIADEELSRQALARRVETNTERKGGE